MDAVGGHDQVGFQFAARYGDPGRAVRIAWIDEFRPRVRTDGGDQLAALVTALGSTAPDRHVLSLVAWLDGLMFSCVAGSFTADVPSLDEVRTGLRALFDAMLRT